MLPGSLPAEAEEEVKSKGRAKVAWQDKSETVQAAAQGGQLCFCPPPPASQCQPPHPTVGLTASGQEHALAAAALGSSSGERGWQDSVTLRWGMNKVTGG